MLSSKTDNSKDVKFPAMERMETNLSWVGANLSWVGTNFSISLVLFLQLPYFGSLFFIDCFVLQYFSKIQALRNTTAWVNNLCFVTDVGFRFTFRYLDSVVYKQRRYLCSLSSQWSSINLPWYMHPVHLRGPVIVHLASHHFYSSLQVM